MTTLADSLSDFLAAHPHVALVKVSSAKGSTPREKGAWMLVTPKRIFGTIGGGQLEYMAIDKARQMLRTPTFRKMGTVLLDIPLGPEIGQCCGGRVGLSVRMVDRVLARDLLEALEAQDAARPMSMFSAVDMSDALWPHRFAAATASDRRRDPRGRAKGFAGWRRGDAYADARRSRAGSAGGLGVPCPYA